MLHWNLVKTAVILGAVAIITAISSGCASTSHAQNPAGQGFPDLPGALRKCPGCLGVETARTTSGKNVIFAWFENKKAVENWYYSDVHRDSMRKFFPEGGAGKPLDGVPDDVGPILTIASITFNKDPKFDETSLPISQIAIELYAPIKGGIFLGETFAPKGMKVPGMQDYSPPPAAKEKK